MKIPVNWLKEYVDIPENLKIFTDKMSMIGHMLDKIEETDDDIVVDLELRGNRADCYSILGIARESHASFGGRFDIPNVIEDLVLSNYQDFKINIESNSVYRFFSTIIKNIKIAPSPEFIQKRLKNYGIDPINNIVDITNYVMIETGMPLHAFDLDKMDGNSLTLRHAKDEEKTTTFDGTTLTLTSADTVFASENGRILGIAGVIGEKESGIHDDTVNILLECAGYDRVAIRRSMFRHKSQTEAGLRHSHDLDSSLCDYTLRRAISLILEYSSTNETQITGVEDYYPNPTQERIISYKPTEAKRLGGIEIPVEQQIDILKRLECKVEVGNNAENIQLLLIRPPLFRTDLLASEDIVEEVLRIYGYENIPSTALSSVIPDPIIQEELVIEEKSRDALVALGLNELVSVPMTTLEKMEAALEPKKDLSITLVNPASSEHTTMRVSLYIGLLESISRMLDRGDEKVEVFEVGKIYHKKDKEIHQPPHKPDFPYVEWRRITAFFSSKNKKDIDFFSTKGVLEEYLDQLQIKNVNYVKFDHPQFEYCASVEQNGLILGAVGLLKRKITQDVFGINSDIYAFTALVEGLVEAEKSSINYMPYSQFPSIKLDMSVLYDPKITATELQNTIRENSNELVRNIEINDVFTKDNQRSILFSITYQSKEKTLSTDEVNELHTKIGDKLIEKFGVTIRGRQEAELQKAQGTNLSKQENNSKKEDLTVLKQEKELKVVKNELLDTRGEELSTNVKEKPQVLPNEKIVVGKILEIEKHPNADKLVICKVDVGKAKFDNTLFQDHLQIITGAANIKPGIDENKFIPVALPGSEVLDRHTGQTMKISKANLRGVRTEAMLCSKDELGLPDDVGGIWILDEEKYKNKVGEMFEINLSEKSDNSSLRPAYETSNLKTELLFLYDSYLKECEAKILSVELESHDQYKIILDQTIFYPMGGGQATDQGVIENERFIGNVYQVINKNGKTEHYIRSEIAPEIGEKVFCRLNWERRYENMKKHSAGHIVDFAIYLLGYSPNILMPYKGDHNKDLYIAYKGVLNEDLKLVEQKLSKKVEELIQNDLPLTTEILPFEEIQREAIYLQPGLPTNKPLRILRLEHVGAVADGGTQVARTSEVGNISVKIEVENGETIVRYSLN